MRKLLSLIFVVTALVAGARQISPDEAAAIASDFLNSPSIQRASGRVAVKRARSANHQAESPFYVFNAADNSGFVIISGDDRARKILGYSDTGAFDLDNMPPQLAALLEQYAEQIEALPASASADASWSAPSAPSATTDGVLLETANWGQGYPYNAQCPVIDGVQAPTGCVATAMAIIMQYHQWPKVGKKENHYSPFLDGPEYSWDFSNFRPKWDLIIQEYSANITDDEAVNAISDLMMAAGIASRVNYTWDSGTTLIDAMVGLRRFLAFGASLQYYQSSNLTNTEWNNLIRQEIEGNRPVLYCCFQSSDNTGHAFVIDGYYDDMLHINWGWEGKANGFYAIENLNPQGFNFDIQHQMVTGICSPGPDDHLYSDYFLYPDGIVNPIYDPTNSINISVENVTCDVPFNCVTPIILWPPHSDATIGLALMDKNNSIKEVIESLPNSNFCDYIDFNACMLGNVQYKTPIESEDRIQIVAQEKNEHEWRIVNSQYNRESSIPVVGNKPKVKPVTWHIDPRLYIEFYGEDGPTSYMPLYVKEPFEEIDPQLNNVLCHFALRGMVSYDLCESQIISSAVKVNGIMRSSQIHDKNAPGGGYLQFVIEGNIEDVNYSELDVEILGFFAEDERKPVEINVTSENDVLEYCTINDCMRVTDLKLTGNGNGDIDLRPIYNNMPFLMSLDLSQYKPKDRTLRPYVFSSVADGDYEASDSYLEILRGEPQVIKTGLQCLRELKLPAELDSIKAGAFYRCNIDHVTIPKSVKYIGRIAFYTNETTESNLNLKYVACESPYPAELCELGFGEVEQKNTILYVPLGSRDNYLNDPEWSKFPQIIEYEGDIDSLDDVVANDIDENIVVYNMSGLEIYTGSANNCPKLQQGIYLIKRRGEITKFAVR